MRRRLFCITAALTLVATAGFVTSPPPQRGPNQALITQVVADTGIGQVVIFGHNFCTDPDVELAGESLSVLGASDDGPIIAVLPGDASEGDSLLTVDCGRGNNGYDSWNLTIGGVGSGDVDFAAPDFQSTWIDVPVGGIVNVAHGLDTPVENQLVDVLMVAIDDGGNTGVVVSTAFVSDMEPDSLNLINPWGPETRTFIVRIWTW